MATIISTKSTAKDGVIKRNDLSKIWTDPDYPLRLHPLLIELLKKFELLHQLDSDGFLFPSLLPETLSFSLESYWSPFPEPHTQQLERLYQFTFIPKSLFSVLMVRLLHLTACLKYWRYGVLTSDQDSEFSCWWCKSNVSTDNVALITVNNTQQSLSITVRGQKPTSLLNMLTTEVDSLVSERYNISGDRTTYIPCSHCVMKRVPEGKRYHFPYSSCVKAAMRNEQFVHCQGVFPVKLSELAPGI